MAWVCEISGYDPVAAAEATRYFALGAGLSFPDGPYIPGSLTEWTSPTQKISISEQGQVASAADAGRIVLSNLPNTIDSAGPLDALAEWAWQRRAATIYWVGATWSSRQVVARGVLEQPVAPLSAGGSNVDSTLVFPLRDPRAALDVPLQATKFLGNNTGGEGVEGDSNLKGLIKPIIYGLVSNIPGVRVNASKLIWQLADKAVTVLCARDGGSAVSAGFVRGTLATLLSNVPSPGFYDTYSGAEGTFVRFGTTPVQQVTFDAQEGASDADRTHAKIWRRIRSERCGTILFNETSITTVDGLDSNVVGFYWDDDISRLEAINEVLRSLSGFEVLTFTGEWKIGRLVTPTGTTSLDLVVLRPGSALTSTMRALDKIVRTRPSGSQNGAPPYRVNVQWGRNYTVMGSGDFLGSTIQRLRDKFSIEWRTETATSNSIWNPTTQTGPWPDAPEMTVQVAYQPDGTGLACPAAATEAARLLALYSALLASYQVTFRGKTTDRCLPGDVVGLTHPQMGLAAGKKFVVLQAGWSVTSAVPVVNLVLGLQS